jgi:DNA-binding transcriptional MerR regulator
MRYYKTGEFAKMANVSIRTIRYYDQKGLLKPSAMTPKGYRLYPFLLAL